MPTIRRLLTSDNLITGQSLFPGELERAKELRQNMTPAEKIIWQRLKAGRLGVHFRRQQIIAGYIADFYCHSNRLVIEIDGPIHQQQSEYDHERDQCFQSMGLRILRLRNEEILDNEENIVQQIRELITTK